MPGSRASLLSELRRSLQMFCEYCSEVRKVLPRFIAHLATTACLEIACCVKVLQKATASSCGVYLQSASTSATRLSDSSCVLHHHPQHVRCQLATSLYA